MRYLAIILILLPIPFYLSQKNNPPLEDQKVELTAAEEARIFEIINNSKKCEIKDDCQLVEAICPFGCKIAVHKNNAQHIEKLLKNVRSSCIYQCRSIAGADCVKNKCTILFNDNFTDL